GRAGERTRGKNRRFFMAILLNIRLSRFLVDSCKRFHISDIVGTQAKNGEPPARAPPPLAPGAREGLTKANDRHVDQLGADGGGHADRDHTLLVAEAQRLAAAE